MDLYELSQWILDDGLVTWEADKNLMMGAMFVLWGVVVLKWKWDISSTVEFEPKFKAKHTLSKMRENSLKKPIYSWMGWKPAIISGYMWKNGLCLG